MRRSLRPDLFTGDLRRHERKFMVGGLVHLAVYIRHVVTHAEYDRLMKRGLL